MITLARRLGASLGDEDFNFVTRPVRAPQAGEVLIQNLVTSVDPYQVRMLRGDMAHQAQRVGDVINAGCVGVVIESRDPRAPVGTQVATYSGWTEYATWTLRDDEIASPELGDEMDWIHTLGTPGITAYVGVHDVGAVQAGSTVAIIGAAGAVGGVAVQICKVAGARVIAVAGGARRVGHTVDTLGADVGLDYGVSDFDRQFRAATPDGVDLLFDNVGGHVLEKSVELLAPRGKAVICGAVSTYAEDRGFNIRLDIDAVQRKRLVVAGFTVGDYYATRLTPVRAALAAMLHSKEITNVVSEFQGLASAPSALRSTFQSGSPYVGKRVVRIF